MSERATELPDSLARYFDAAVPMVLGALAATDDERRAEQLQEALGASPSGTSRLALARVFVRWQARYAMHTLYARLERAWDRVEPGRFATEVTHWIDTHRAITGDPASIGEGFDAHLAALSPAAPEWASEMADLVWTTFWLRRAPIEHGLRPHALRFYRFRPYTTEALGAAWIIASKESGEVVFSTVGRAEVMALAHAKGEAVERTEAERAQGEAFLRTLASGKEPTEPKG